MKKYLLFAIVYALLSVGCSEKKDELQAQQTSVSKERTLTKELTKKKIQNSIGQLTDCYLERF